MEKIIDYDIFTTDNERKLVEIIREKIKEGFQPFGFMEMKGEYQYTTYTQVMVKYDDGGYYP